MIFFSIQGQSSNPVPIFIGLFVAFAGYSEFKQVEITEAVRGRVVAEAMICTKTMVSEDLSLKDLAKKWKGTSDRMLPVVNAGGHPIGMVQMSKLISSLSQPDSDTKLVSSLIDRNQPLKLVKDSELLEQALPKLDRRIRQHLVVDDQGVVTGVIDLDTMVQRLCLHDQESNEHTTAEVRHFDQIN
jgi:predicted transcriptional regulator